MRKKKRKSFGIFCVILGGIFAFAGCAAKNTEEAAKMTEAEKEKLVLWSYYETQAQRESMDCLVRDFNQSQNQYELVWEYIPMTGFNKSLSSAYAENNLPDMALLDHPDMPFLIQLGMFEDITEQVKEWEIPDTFYPSIVETACYDGKYYGVPFNCNNTALIYNKKILADAGITPPENLEELREKAKALTTETRKGFLMCGIEGEQGAFQMLSWILSEGESIEDPQITGTENAFSYIQELLEDQSLSEDFINLTQTDVAREFVEGKTAMMQNGPWVFPMLDENGMEYGIVPLPSENGPAAVVGGENIGVLKGKNKEGTLAFIDFCMKSDNMLKFCEASNVLPGNRKLAEEMVKKAENMQVFEQQMHTAVTRTAIKKWTVIKQRITDGLLGIVSGEQTPGKIAAELWK